MCEKKQIKADMREGERGIREYMHPCINKRRKTEARIVLHDAAQKPSHLSVFQGESVRRYPCQRESEQIKCEGDQTSLSLS